MKIVRKLNRADRYDVDGVQSWLEEMAARGLHLTHWGELWSKFRCGEPASVRYRLDPGRMSTWDGEPSRETQEDYEEMGWSYVCTIDKAFHIFRADDPRTPELFTDPASQAMAMKQVGRSARQNLVQTVVLFLAMLFWWGRKLDVVEAITRDSVLFYIVAWLLYLALTVSNLYHNYRVLRTCQTLEEGRSIPKSSRWHRWIGIGHSLCTLFLVGLLLLSLRGESRQVFSEYHPLEAVPISVPTLTELENRPNFVLDGFKEDYGYGFHPEEGTYARPEASLLAPIQYTIVQTGRDKTVFWQELLPQYAYNMRYGPSLSIRLWETQGDSLARTLLEEELEQVRGNTDYVLARNMTVEGFDQALLYRNSDWCTWRLFIQKGPRAAVVHYHGAQDLADHLAPFLILMEGDWTLP